MNVLLESLFFVSVLIILHVYLFYPIIILIISKLFGKSMILHKDIHFEPTVSIIISAYNEEKVIENTIRNFMNSNYPMEKVEFIIGSDFSTDRTNEIMNRLSHKYSNIKFFPFSVQRGKGPVLNDLVKQAKNEILILSDANTIFAENSIKLLIKYYSDKSVGAVSGRLILTDFEESINSGTQETLYWNLEYFIKKAEGNLGILIGANGGIYSLRRELYTKIPTEYPVMDDFFVILKVLEKHKKVVYEENALAYEKTAPSIQSELRRKVRNNSIDLSTIRGIKKLLSPTFGLVAFALWSHKILRWFSPIFLLLIFVLSGLLAYTNLYFLYFFVAELIFLLAGILGKLLSLLKINSKILLIIYYFIITNYAMLIGIWKFMTNSHSAKWQSTAR